MTNDTDRPGSDEQAPGRAGIEEKLSHDDSAADSLRASTVPDSTQAKELEDAKERFLRLAAEFDNYRKRSERERLESRDRAQAQLLERILDPLDDLQRVASSGEGASVASLMEGIQLLQKKLLRLLETAGLEVIDPRGERFDPTVHEALMTTAADAQEEDETIGEVFQSGYRFNGILLRPARVQVRQHGG